MTQAALIGLLLPAVHVLIVLVAAVLISTNRRPSSAIAWILAVIFIPVLGILFFCWSGSASSLAGGGTSSGKCAKPSWPEPTGSIG